MVGGIKVFAFWCHGKASDGKVVGRGEASELECAFFLVDLVAGYAVVTAIDDVQVFAVWREVEFGEVGPILEVCGECRNCLNTIKISSGWINFVYTYGVVLLVALIHDINRWVENWQSRTRLRFGFRDEGFGLSHCAG